ncbi:unnamed protein product [Ceutorhynchus assimilis]|uniref:Uncharacterized protein n=1 Tax=Ceutorhynchus assimilis TaxID=467358 RepID=A0A9N9MR08_9CUCU|nr:unnamed protein product [Ceutorhynchus assimilis]
MFSLRFKKASLNQYLLKKTLQRLYATSIKPIEKESTSDEEFNRELKKYDRLTNIATRTREKKPQREPFVKNLLIGQFDREILTFPEMELEEVRNVEEAVEKLSQVLQQRHMVNVNSIGNKNFRQNLADHRAIGLQSSQFLDGRECCPMELMRFLDTLSEHKLGNSLLHNEMLGVQTLNKFADDNLKKKYLHSVIKGEQLSAFAMHEIDVMDILKMNTTAVLSDDKKYWTLNGTKSLVVNGISADFVIVFAITDKAHAGHDESNSLTAFVVDKSTSGVSWKKIEPSNIEMADITFDNVQVPAENVIGKVHQADKILRSIIGDFRLSAGPACNAISRRMVQNLFKHIAELSTTEYNLADTDAMKSKLGQVAMELYAAESVTYLTAGLQDWYDEQDVEVESAIVKVFTSEAAYRISTICLDLVGQHATTTNHWARQAHEEILDYLTVHETNESQRMFMALNGLQHAGINLAAKIKRIRNPFFNATYSLMRIFTEHRQNEDKPKLDLELNAHLHPSLSDPSKQLEYCVKRLEFGTERLLARHGIECINKHADLRRLADIMIDCYVCTAVLARSSRSYCIGLQFADYEVLAASIYCNIAMERVRTEVRNLYFTEYKATDRNYIAFGKRVVQSKGYCLTNAISRFF